MVSPPPAGFCVLREALCCVPWKDDDDIRNTKDKCLTKKQTSVLLRPIFPRVDLTRVERLLDELREVFLGEVGRVYQTPQVTCPLQSIERPLLQDQVPTARARG